MLLEEPATSVLGGTKRTRRRDPAMPAFEVPQRVRRQAFARLGIGMIDGLSEQPEY